ncbi:hypothetical protein GH714_001195 [Hevea brasiliensis]|uniref:Uncharacterized protein n=1 Tax=Hevea brasiliensis TaxID=3981 RepID=A0A6A6M9T6_HEVBR|nr:hypothetical protein GH714_001195 [Hevea brasiliensis]
MQAIKPCPYSPEKSVGVIIPYNSLFGVRYSYGRNMVKFYNKTVTVFATRDEADRIENWITLEYQMVRSKVDDESFPSGSLSEGSVLRTSDFHALEVTQVPLMGYPSINKVTITQWNIYNDGHVIVHGVEYFFPRWQRHGEILQQDNYCFCSRDEAVPIEDWMALGNQIVRYKVDDESFRSGSFKEGSVLHTLNSHALEVTQVPWMGYPSINNVTITQWNLIMMDMS